MVLAGAVTTNKSSPTQYAKAEVMRSSSLRENALTHILHTQGVWGSVYYLVSLVSSGGLGGRELLSWSMVIQDHAMMGWKGVCVGAGPEGFDQVPYYSLVVVAFGILLGRLCATIGTLQIGTTPGYWFWSSRAQAKGALARPITRYYIRICTLGELQCSDGKAKGVLQPYWSQMVFRTQFPPVIDVAMRKASWIVWQLSLHPSEANASANLLY
ncbi:hypothetical protein OG21DRAFT_1522634 [Imleria badia]|nr:hypothetical protein OG21DRAFT_1522634 [Imleria badia]